MTYCVIRVAKGGHAFISIIFNFTFRLASFGLVVAPASHRSTCCNEIECFVDGSRINVEDGRALQFRPRISQKGADYK